jgi:hypothetical protein
MEISYTATNQEYARRRQLFHSSIIPQDSIRNQEGWKVGKLTSFLLRPNNIWIWLVISTQDDIFWLSYDTKSIFQVI